ncbi:MAG: hypothetical protein ACR2LI_12190 [Propionibacteriaceae bacterium]
MRASHHDVAAILRRDLVICRNEHPELASAIDWLVRTGRLQAVLRGVYAAAVDADGTDCRIVAVHAAVPGAVLTGRAAARVGYLPELSVSVVTAAVGYSRPSPPGFAFQQTTIPPALVRHRRRCRFAAPALAALQLSDEIGGEAIDDVLRVRAATLSQLHAALTMTPHRAGNRARRALLLDSRDEPWSEAERRFHRLLRRLGRTGWRANLRVVVGPRIYYLDVAFPRQRVAIEIDGRIAHIGATAFAADRLRQNDLMLAGWVVLRLTVAQSEDEVYVAKLLRSALGHPDNTVRLNG